MAAGSINSTDAARPPAARSSRGAFQREAGTEADEDDARDAVEGPFDAGTSEDVPPTRRDRRVADQPGDAHRVEEHSEHEEVGSRTVRTDELREEAREEDRDLRVEHVADEPL